MNRIVPLLGVLLAAGCGQPELNPDAFHWDVVVSGFDDQCNEPAVPSKDNFTYSLSFEGSLVDLAIGWDSFASGTISGCSIRYESPLVGQDHGGHQVQWELAGEGFFRQGRDDCEMGEKVQQIYDNNAPLLDFEADWEQRSDVADADRVDWVSVETFRIISDEAEDLPVNCTYTSLVVGSFVVAG